MTKKLMTIFTAVTIFMVTIFAAKAEDYKYQDVKNKIEFFKQVGDTYGAKNLQHLLDSTNRHKSNLKRLEMIKSLASGYKEPLEERIDYQKLVKDIKDYTTEEERSYTDKAGKEHKYWKSTYERDLKELDKYMKYTDYEIETYIYTTTNSKGEVIKTNEHKFFKWK